MLVAAASKGADVVALMSIYANTGPDLLTG